ncbi:hypothetical protein FGO68_gene11164 [Halteria grandinella]|uniref:Uncharacterized protein n=1 Tax=Halteria grandinella TaxID=5974 RepID=A0A8J8NP50_HALGN|nr:hypothetical protein FGO68_gene11164 [Halteria grandinella]
MRQKRRYQQDYSFDQKPPPNGWSKEKPWGKQFPFDEQSTDVVSRPNEWLVRSGLFEYRRIEVQPEEKYFQKGKQKCKRYRRDFYDQECEQKEEIQVQENIIQVNSEVKLDPLKHEEECFDDDETLSQLTTVSSYYDENQTDEEVIKVEKCLEKQKHQGGGRVLNKFIDKLFSPDKFEDFEAQGAQLRVNPQKRKKKRKSTHLVIEPSFSIHDDIESLTNQCDNKATFDKPQCYQDKFKILTEYDHKRLLKFSLTIENIQAQDELTDRFIESFAEISLSGLQFLEHQINKNTELPIIDKNCIQRLIPTLNMIMDYELQFFTMEKPQIFLNILEAEKHFHDRSALIETLESLPELFLNFERYFFISWHTLSQRWPHTPNKEDEVCPIKMITIYRFNPIEGTLSLHGLCERDSHHFNTLEGDWLKKIPYGTTNQRTWLKRYNRLYPLRKEYESIKRLVSQQLSQESMLDEVENFIDMYQLEAYLQSH